MTRDTQEQLAWDSEICVVVLGNAAGEALLVDLDVSLPPLHQRRGFCFCGVLGFRQGECIAEMERTVESLGCAFSASLQFGQLVAEKFRQSGVEWLKRLYSLPDPRMEN